MIVTLVIILSVILYGDGEQIQTFGQVHFRFFCHPQPSHVEQIMIVITKSSCVGTYPTTFFCRRPIT